MTYIPFWHTYKPFSFFWAHMRSSEVLLLRYTWRDGVLSVCGRELGWDAHIRNCEGLWSDAMHTRCFEVVFPCRSRNPPPSQLILVEGTPLQSLFRRLSARSSTLKVLLTRWIRTVSQNQLEFMEQLPTMVPFILLVLMPTSNAFHLPGQRNHGERSDSQFCMTENNVSLCV